MTNRLQRDVPLVRALTQLATREVDPLIREHAAQSLKLLRAGPDRDQAMTALGNVAMDTSRTVAARKEAITLLTLLMLLR